VKVVIGKEGLQHHFERRHEMGFVQYKQRTQPSKLPSRSFYLNQSVNPTNFARQSHVENVEAMLSVLEKLP
jgi:hypothetical protein